MENKNHLISTLLQYLQDEDVEQISIDDDSFIVQLSDHNRGGFWKRGARLVGLIFTAIVILAFLIYGIIFYSQNVLYYRGELEINQFGAFIPRKSYSNEYGMYLFDTSEKWVSSGIQVQKGDRLFISASGGFHSNYKELVNAANNNTLADTCYERNNSMVRARWTFFPRSVTAKKDTANAAYKYLSTNRRRTAYFGDVLFQVVPEYMISDVNYADTNRIYAIPCIEENRHPITIRQDGVLAFMVNDNKTGNNIGQVLVVMEIFRRTDLPFWKAFKRFFYRWLDVPYYHYELLRHEGHVFMAAMLFICLVIFKMAVFSTVAYYLPLLIYYALYLSRQMIMVVIRKAKRTKIHV